MDDGSLRQNKLLSRKTTPKNTIAKSSNVASVVVFVEHPLVLVALLYYS
jgi:hypothetical protein